MTKRVDQLREGFYRTRLIRRGLHVGVMIWFAADGWRVVCDGQTHNADGTLLDPFELWPFVEPISHREFAFLKNRASWAREFAPEHPAANPRRPIDRRKLKPLIGGKP